MKINGSTDAARVDRATGAGVAPERAEGTPGAPAEGEKVRLSGLSGQLAELEAKLTASGEFDQARIDRIKEAIAGGEYRINADAIADKLIQNVRDLLAGKL
jgi:negative regulator of flagellin synthesis FlgM